MTLPQGGCIARGDMRLQGEGGGSKDRKFWVTSFMDGTFLKFCAKIKLKLHSVSSCYRVIERGFKKIVLIMDIKMDVHQFNCFRCISLWPKLL